MDPKAPTKKKRRDPYRNIKWLGYRLSQLPDRYGLKELVNFAKFQLAVKTKRLLKDPIWDQYTIEELLIEFYAHQFEDNKQFRVAFEQEIGSGNTDVDDFAAWADKKIAEEAKIRNRLMGEAEDKVSFSPDDIMGDS